MTALPFLIGLLSLGAWPLDSSWAGLQSFSETAAEARVSFEVQSAVNWAEISPMDTLVLVAPQAPLPVQEILVFLRDGGALLVFDDWGHSEGLLKEFGIGREAPPLDHGWHYQGHPDFPMFGVATDADLFFNMHGLESVLVGNHPSGLSLPPGVRGIVPLVSYEGKSGLHFALEVSIDRGHMMVVADSSLVINEMQSKHGNKQFLANALRRYCRKEPCTGIGILPGATWHGTYAVRGNKGVGLQDAWNRFKSAVLTWLQDPEKLKAVQWAILVWFFILMGMRYRLALRPMKDRDEARAMLAKENNRKDGVWL